MDVPVLIKPEIVSGMVRRQRCGFQIRVGIGEVMKEMREHKNFWDKNAGRYDRFMRKDRAAYEKIYALIRPVVKAKTVLELATGRISA